VDLRHMAIAHAVLIEATAKAEAQELESTEMQGKWRKLGDLALSNGDIPLAEQCAQRSADLSGLLLLYTSAGNKQGMVELATTAREAGRFNVAFLAYFLTGQVEEAIQLLIDANRIPEAAFMARTYMPSQISRVLEIWKRDLKTINEKAAEALADPVKYPNLFPDLSWALKVEELFLSARHNHVAASAYPDAKGDLNLDLIAMVKAQWEAKEVAEVEQQNESAEAEAIAMSLANANIQDDNNEDEAEEEAEEQEEDDIVESEEKAYSAPASPARSPVAAPAPASPLPTPPASPVRTPEVVVQEQVMPPSPPKKEEEVVAEEEEEEEELNLDDIADDNEGEEDEVVDLSVGEEEQDQVEQEQGEATQKDVLDEDFEDGEDW